MDIVINPLKGKQVSEIPPLLKQSLNTLERYCFCLILFFSTKLFNTNSDLIKVLEDVEKKLKLSKIDHIINHEEHMAMIKNMNDQITSFLEFYSVRSCQSLFFRMTKYYV